MQFTAVWIKQFLLQNMSINDICCYMPAWFGSIATVVTGLIAYECSVPSNATLTPIQIIRDFFVHGKPSYPPPEKHTSLPLGISSPALECALFSMAIMAISPAHLMRSVGGGYDNESVAMTAMCLTFYFWIRSLRSGQSWWFGILAGTAYFYMVASWGGYIFVINMVGLHAALLVAMGRFTTKVYLAYSCFYVVGTSLAIQIPVVGWAPLKSLEQLAPCFVFLCYQGLQLCEVIRKRQNLGRVDAWKLRLKVAVAGVIVLAILIMAVAPKGYFGPLSSRVRGLFVQHTKTGNPLVDSVAEHQPASNKAYFQYLHNICLVAPLGYLVTMAHMSDASSFLLAWGAATYFFSHRMVRLILLTAPISSILGGIAAGRIVSWSIQQLWDASSGTETTNIVAEAVAEAPNGENTNEDAANGTKGTKKGRKVKKHPEKQSVASSGITSEDDPFASVKGALDSALASNEGIMIKRSLAGILLIAAYMMGSSFKNYAWRLSGDLSHPSIIVRARTRTGKVIKVDDYREAYWWLRDNTPEDARILAWWDYGYQIAGIANRTTIADGNTWNHEHIALLGKCLTTKLEEGHEIARQLADYVLIWAGGGGDDLAKSPHLARIANSVYRDHCPKDPTCRAFGFIDRQGTPSPMMQRSLLYQLHGHGLKDDVSVSPDLFEEVYRSKYGKVRIYKVSNVDLQSKRWVADPSNRKCDVPGSWFCPGQYPPGLAKILGTKKDFAQLEDFNRGIRDEEYQKEYFEALKDPAAAQQRALNTDAAYRGRTVKKVVVNPDGSVGDKEDVTFEKPDRETIDRVYNDWKDTVETTAMWSLINQNRVDELKEWLQNEPSVAFVRSADGRGPMFWAYESRNQDIVKLLMKLGVPDTDKDGKGLTPADLLQVER
jgi:dolichyl-diphosphooligosaccharide--protein glycosyltransferase